MESDRVSTLRACWGALGSVATGGDYILLGEDSGAFAARSHSGHSALVLQVPSIGEAAAGRRAAGCELRGHRTIRFEYNERVWHGAAAALVCTDQSLIDSFAVLAADVALRTRDDRRWETVLAAVEDWQNLLASRGRLTPESEIGLWGELWFIARSTRVDRLVAAWRGPEGDTTDFFVDGIGAEVKTSRHRGRHWVSQSQIDAPVGTKDAWLTSLWVKEDPSARCTLVTLVDDLIERASDKPGVLRKLGLAGFAPADRVEYRTGFVLLSEPRWYPAATVPRVRTADPGVSDLRYRVTFPHGTHADEETVARLTRHFHGDQDGKES